MLHVAPSISGTLAHEPVTVFELTSIEGGVMHDSESKEMHELEDHMARQKCKTAQTTAPQAASMCQV
jgi:hypothetical protein